jgi:hypothetical protein
MILIGRGMAQFHYPRGNPFMLLRILSMDAGKLQQIQTHARAIAALLYDETAPEQLTTFLVLNKCVLVNQSRQSPSTIESRVLC